MRAPTGLLISSAFVEHALPKAMFLRKKTLKVAMSKLIKRL